MKTPHSYSYALARTSRTLFVLLLATLLAGGPLPATAQNAPAAAPKFLYEPNASLSAGKVADAHETVRVTPSQGGLHVEVSGSDAGYPGFAIVPTRGATWDLSPWGHVAAKVTNTGTRPLSVSLRVDDHGDWRKSPWNCESAYLKAGETKLLKVIFGYQYGFKPGHKLNRENVTKLLFFVGKSSEARSFRLEDILAGGPAGEMPPIPPDQVVETPPRGLLLGKGCALKHALKLDPKDGVHAAWTATAGQSSLLVKVPAGKKSSLALRPGMGSWNLNTFHEVQVRVRNKGAAPISPSLRIASKSGSTDTATAASPLAPGAQITLRASFVPARSWVGISDPKSAYNGGAKGTGTEFDSSRVQAVVLHFPESATEAQLEVLDVLAAAPPATLPPWLGKRPPIEGAWKQTLAEEFNGASLNLKLWNIYTPNYWDKRTHFSKDNVLVKDGKLILRYEQKTGFHNDDPTDKSSVAQTDFACGFADSYGKWTQRYGYFEARMKLPRCPGLWPAFWTMPDRGGDPDPSVNPQWKRASTSDGGMEFDIMEHLTAWGPYRFNFAYHWDGYGKEHKALGSSNAYVPADKEGYITIGMLWLPGEVVYYGNGVEFARWKSERVCSVQSYPIFYMVSGGWANVPLDPEQLPDEFVIDYFRAWQRADLASPDDGPKPNAGAPRSQF